MRFNAIYTLIILSMILSGCLCSKPTPTKVRIGINVWPGYEFLHLANELGYYKEEGLDVQMIEFSSLGDTRRAFERGQIDIMPGTMIELFLSRINSTHKAQAFIAADYSNGADVIISRKGINTVAELKGKKIGYEAGTLNLVLLKMALSGSGINLNEVTPINLPQDNTIKQALKNGEVDAIVTYPPISIDILKELPSNVIFDSQKVSGKIIDVICADADFATKNKSIISSIQKAYFKALKYSKEMPNEAYSIMAKREGITLEEFKSAITDGIILLSQEQQSEYLAKDGKIAKVAPEIINALVETGQIKEVKDFGDITIPYLQK